MRDAEPASIRLADYRPSDFQIDEITLVFALEPEATIVTAESRVRRAGQGDASLILSGERLDLQSVAIDGRTLAPSEYRIEPGRITIENTPDAFALRIVTRINPSANTALEGLYMSAGRFCTQCEAEGFRAITFALDRPDVLARYRVRIEADAEAYPTLLSNGDLIETGALPGGRHFAEWNDPHPKPAYLFALVAGRFDHLADSFVTKSGRQVTLGIYVDPGDAPRAAYAMDALKRAMAWDEEKFGREYDLEIFNIVAVRDFNFGAMENKGLNIFNSSLILADAQIAGDMDFEAIEAVVGHEYFHNWTGNRITCRDWFQLCLKEGLTVFREQEFSADQRSRPVQRIKDVKRLRARQFSEDAGPLAHPVRPSIYQKIDNFYTATVYEKGGEVIRMLKTLIGDEAFARGMAIYFETRDGTASTVEDFIACFERASGRDLAGFMGWYDQAGTPHVRARASYDEAAQTLDISLQQWTPPTPGQNAKRPLPIPLRIGLIGRDGRPIEAALGNDSQRHGEHLMVLDSADANIRLTQVAAAPIPALLRGFSAPIVLDDGLPMDDRLVQMAHDPDPFTRWEAGQSISRALLLSAAPAEDVAKLIASLGRELGRADADPAFAALALRQPDLSELINAAAAPDPEALFAKREALRRAIADAHYEALAARATAPAPAVFSPAAADAGRRALKSAALDLIAARGAREAPLLMRAFEAATCMSESISALEALGTSGADAFEAALDVFFTKWRDAPLVIDKWFAAQAAAPRPDALERVTRLRARSDFDIRNPNRVRALGAAFSMRNLRAFHAADGGGYAFLASLARDIDPINPALAARLLTPFENWRRFDAGRQAAAQSQLRDVAQLPNLSKNTREMVERTLA